MRFFISGASTTVEEFARNPRCRPYLGLLTTPDTGNSLKRMLKTGLPYGVDNACFNHEKFSPRRYLRLLRRLFAVPYRPTFITVPDVVGDCQATLALWCQWHPHLVEMFGKADEGWPWAFVLQDGIRSADEVPWDHCAAVFIGGTDDFKDDLLLTCEIIPEAIRRGKYIHMGRVNGRQRISLALGIGCHSVDGTSLSRYCRIYLPKHIASLEHAERQIVRTNEANRKLELELLRMGVKPVRLLGGEYESDAHVDGAGDLSGRSAA